MNKLANAGTNMDSLAAGYLETAPDAILAVDPSGIITLANQQAYVHFGYDEARDELIGISVDQLVPHRFRAGHGSRRDSYLENGERRPMGDPGSAVHAQRKDGTLLPVDIALSPIATGDERGTIAIIRDQTKQLQAMAEAEAEQVQQTLDAIADAIFYVDPATLEISHINNAARQKTGYDRDALISGMTLSDFAVHISPRQFRTMLTPLSSDEDPVVSQTTAFRTKDGREFPVEITCRYSSNSRGVGEKIMVNVRDLSEIQDLEDRARSVEKFFQAAFQEDTAPMVVTRDVEGDEIIIDTNHAFHALLGLDDVDLAATRLAELHVDGTATTVGAPKRPLVERQYRHSDGTYIWTSTQSTVLHNEYGEATTFARVEDISRRVKAERERDQRQLMLAALRRIHQATTREEPTGKILRNTIEIIGDLFASDHAFIATPSSTGSGGLKYRSTSSTMTQDKTGQNVPETPVIVDAVTTGQVCVVDDFTDYGQVRFGPGMCAPVASSKEFMGVVVMSRRPGAERFSADEIALARELASEVALTVAVGRTREESRQAELARGRKVAARQFHAAGLQQLTAARDDLREACASATPDLQAQAEKILDELDSALKVVREAASQLAAADS